MNTFPIIVVDIGNTVTRFALARKGVLSHTSCLVTKGQNRKVISDALTGLVRARKVNGAIICSVVPALNHLWTRELTNVAGRKPLRINCRMNLGIEIDYPEPDQIGADRLANACAAAERYGTPVVVADFGTALTFDVISKENTYLGGVIAPGLPLMTDYLAERTALLPHLSFSHRESSIHIVPVRGGGTRKISVAVGKKNDVLKNAIGKSTKEAILIGARLGYRGMVREIISHLRKDLKSRSVRLCATGGYANWVLSGSGLPVSIDPDLTLYGVSRIYELNQ